MGDIILTEEDCLDRLSSLFLEMLAKNVFVRGVWEVKVYLSILRIYKNQNHIFYLTNTPSWTKKYNTTSLPLACQCWVWLCQFDLC